MFLHFFLIFCISLTSLQDFTANLMFIFTYNISGRKRTGKALPSPQLMHRKCRVAHPLRLLISSNRKRESEARWLTQKTSDTSAQKGILSLQHHCIQWLLEALLSIEVAHRRESHMKDSA